MLNYICVGDGRPLVFLHGWGGSTTSFLGLANLLKHSFKCYLIDFYGFGKTPHPDYALHLADYAKGVEDFLEQNDLTDVTLVGHSFGGRVCIKLAQNKRVKRLIIFDGAGIKPRRKPSYYFRVFKYKIKKRLGLNTKDSGSADYRALPSVMRGTFCNVVNENLKPLLKNITLPTLLVWGDVDNDTPVYMGRIMNKKIKNSTLIVFEGAGHFSYLEQPIRAAGVINAFCVEEVE